MRSQRAMLRKYRDEKKISVSQYHDMYYKVKGNQFRNKRILLETIISIREEAQRAAQIQARAQNAKSAAETKDKAAKGLARRAAAK